MQVDVEELIQTILSQMEDVMRVKSAEIPNINLYMDQVTTFMTDKLSESRRDSASKEPVFTKTMINNYAKNDLIPPPVKKKYSKEHMMNLIMIYYFKNIMSIGDIKVLSEPMRKDGFAAGTDFGVENIYDGILTVGENRVADLKEDLYAKYETSLKLFQDVPEEDREYLQLFSYVCLLSYDIFVKKLLIERIIDRMKTEQGSGRKESGKKESAKKDAAKD